MPPLLLAGDIGGTKTLLGLFERGHPRPRRIAVRSYPTATFNSLTEIVDAFARDLAQPLRVDAAVAGVAGPVVDDVATLTNVVWNVSARELSTRCNGAQVRLLNDLEAMAFSAEVLDQDELVTLQEGEMRADGNAVVIAAGTGLGEAYLHRVNGRLWPLASEGGHADFAPRTDREIALLKILRTDYGRAEVEHVLSGPGLLNLHRFTHEGQPCAAMREITPELGPAAISQAALAAHCPACVEALAMFVSAYGAETGNLALRGMATAGAYIGGGMAPKILPALEDGRFLEAFRAKGLLSELVARMPVKVIVNPEAGLLGAAVNAQELVDL